MSFVVKPAENRHPPTAVWYREYTQSKRWNQFRKHVIAKRGDICEDCKVNKFTVLHHTTYARVKHELQRDVRLLCNSCHHLAHKTHAIPYLFLIYEEHEERVEAYLLNTRWEPKFDYPRLRRVVSTLPDLNLDDH